MSAFAAVAVVAATAVASGAMISAAVWSLQRSVGARTAVLAVVLLTQAALAWSLAPIFGGQMWVVAAMNAAFVSAIFFLGHVGKTGVER